MKDGTTCRGACGGTKPNLGHTGGNTDGHRLCGHRRLRLFRVLPARLILIVTEVANLPLDADEGCVRKVKGVNAIARSQPRTTGCQSENGEAPRRQLRGMPTRVDPLVSPESDTHHRWHGRPSSQVI